ncbi:RDD family protein [Streptosporangium soli]|nr:RDD family protein [Streptosporangium sp. KLBMP 9127]
MGSPSEPHDPPDWSPPPGSGGAAYGVPPTHGPTYGGPPPDHGEWALPLSGRWRRLFAGLIDIVIVAILTSPLSYNVVRYTDEGIERISVSHGLLSALVAFLYYWLLHAFWNGQTVGKKIIGIRVVQERDGRKIDVGQAAIREAVMVVLIWLCCLGIIDVAWILFDPRRQALHDKAAKTLVIDA